MDERTAALIGAARCALADLIGLFGECLDSGYGEFPRAALASALELHETLRDMDSDVSDYDEEIARIRLYVAERDGNESEGEE